jgi:hypothetical protein
VKLWLDDIRLPPEGWVWVKTVELAIAALKTGDVETASLDYELTFASVDYDRSSQPRVSDEDWERRRTGYAVVCWMEENNVWPPDGVRVHSEKAAGRERMQAVIDRHYGEERTGS